MTSAEFAARYKLLKRITEQGVRSFNAQGSTGRPVMVHYFDESAGSAQQALATRLRHLDAADRAKVVEALEVDGTPVLVTQFLPGFTTLEDWLASRVPPEPTSFSSVFKTVPQPDARPVPPASAAPVAPTASPAPADAHSAPTQLLQVPSVAALSPPSESPSVSAPQPSVALGSAPVMSAPVVSAPPPPAPAASPAGEFTRMFSATVEPPVAPAPAPSAQVSPPAAVAPAETVRPAAAPRPAPAPSVAPTPPLARAEPGEFTRMFQSPVSRDESPAFGQPQTGAVPPQHQQPSFAPTSSPVHPHPGAAPSLGGSNRVFDTPLGQPAPAREVPRDRIVPLSGSGAPPQSVTGIMGVRHAEPTSQPPADMFAFGPAVPPPIAATPPSFGASASPAPLFPGAGIPAAPVIQQPVMPAPPAAPVLAAPSIGAAAGAAITLGIAAASTPPANAPPGAAPSEFTRVLQGVAAPAAAGAVITGAAIAAQKKQDAVAGRTGPSIVPLVIGLNILLVAAIALIIYFVLAG